VPVEVVMCLTWVLVGGLVCLAWDMLFVVVEEGRLLISGDVCHICMLCSSVGTLTVIA
jgi:hypothetical protein